MTVVNRRVRPSSRVRAAVSARRGPGASPPGARTAVNDPDPDPDAAPAVGGDIGGTALPGAACGPETVAGPPRAARSVLGGTGPYRAVAGIAVGGSEQAGDVGGERAWQVSVMSRVRAARSPVPGGAGRGPFRTPVSAGAGTFFP